MKKVSLPKKPSELIRIAVADLKRVERSKKYKVDMRRWHEPNGKCKVCFAGSVMAFTCKVNPKEGCSFDSFDYSSQRKFLFLNNARLGKMGSAFTDLGRSYIKGSFFTRKIVAYRGKYKNKFKQQMLTLASDLEKAGY